MLVNFKVKNFKSFKDLTEFSMEATKLKNLKDSNTFDINNISLLKSAVVYGANASGKSNLLNAITRMKILIQESINLEKMNHYVHVPFLLNSKSEEEKTFFEIEFIIDEIVYRYSFTINIKGVIIHEYLFQKKLKSRAKEITLFERNMQNISIGASFNEGKQIEGKTRENALFIAVVAQFNGKISQKILSWINKLNIISNLKTEFFKEYTYSSFENKKFKEKIIKFIKNSDLGIHNIDMKKIKYEELLKEKNINQDYLKSLNSETVKNLQDKGINFMKTQHIQYDENNKFVKLKSFELEMESDGTQLLIALSGPIIDTLLHGRTIIIDELDNSLHTELLKAIVQLFNSKETNPNNAQLIFTTHDTNLLNQKYFRRDQIWFTEKNIYGATDLYSLVEYGKGKTRDDLELAKNYLKGQFGAIPHITLDYGDN